jgi:hypothetical protein
MREGRRVTIEIMPSQTNQAFYNVKALHEMLFSFNIYAVKAAQHANARVLHLSGWMAQVDFETAISWETGRPGEHFSARDLGSAKGTNFEKVCIAP